MDESPIDLFLKPTLFPYTSSDDLRNIRLLLKNAFGGVYDEIDEHDGIPLVPTRVPRLRDNVPRDGERTPTVGRVFELDNAQIMRIWLADRTGETPEMTSNKIGFMLLAVIYRITSIEYFRREVLFINNRTISGLAIPKRSLNFPELCYASKF